MARPIIWVLDDSAIVAFVLRRALARSGYQVKQVDDDPDAILSMGQNSTDRDVFLIDYRLASKTGLQVCRELRSKWNRTTARIFLVSAYLDSDEIEEEARTLNVETVAKDYRTLDYILNRLEPLGVSNWHGPVADAVRYVVEHNTFLFVLAFGAALISYISEMTGVLPTRSTEFLLGPIVGVVAAIFCIRLARQPQRSKTVAILLHVAAAALVFEILLYVKSVLETL